MFGGRAAAGGYAEPGVEFGKVNRGEVWKIRLFWMLAGIFLVMAAQSAAGIIYAGVDLLLVHVRLNMYLAGSIGVIVNICFFLFLLFVLFKLIRRMSGRMYWQNKPVLLLLFSAFDFFPDFLFSFFYFSDITRKS